MTSQTKPAFSVINQLSEALTPTGKQVTDLATGYVQSSTTGVRLFDWTTFKNFVDNYKGDDLTFDQFSNDKIDQGNRKVSDIVENITNFYSHATSLDKAVLQPIVTTVFTELKKALSGGWADFFKVDAKTSGWQYRIIFLLPYGSATGFFKGVLTTIKIQAEVADEAGWYDLTVDSVLKGASGIVDLMGLVVTKGFENPLFNAVYLGLSSDLVPTSQQVMRFLNEYAENTTSFDWSGFKQAINEYKGDDLTFDKYSQGDASEAKQTVKQLVDKIVAFIHDSFGGSIDVAKLTETIITTITSLLQESGYGYLDFIPVSDNKSTWEYRTVVFTPMASLQSYFYSTVITIRITADVGEESSWWGLQPSSSKVFSASTSALNLVVGKSYEHAASK